MEILRFVPNISQLYKEMFPYASALESPVTGSIITIYTQGGTGILGVRKPKGVLHTSVAVFSPKRKFYAPKYGEISSTSTEDPDLRTVISWNPQILVDSTGNASSSFYNTNTTGEVMIVAEAISENLISEGIIPRCLHRIKESLKT